MKPGAIPVTGKVPKYTTVERAFVNEIFLAMEDAGIIIRQSGQWGARTKFPPKKKGSTELRVVHNFIPVNRYTIKSSYPVHNLEQTLDIILQPGFDVYFSSDTANGYWAISIKAKDCNKTGFITPNGQWVYLCMGQRLKGAAHTYSQFTDTVFSPLPKVGNIPRMPTVIGVRKNDSFGVYMDDHIGAARNFDTMFDFLYKTYFPRVAFGPVYLSGKNMRVFVCTLELLRFEKSQGELRPSAKHRRKIEEPLISRNREELDAFL